MKRIKPRIFCFAGLQSPAGPEPALHCAAAAEQHHAEVHLIGAPGQENLPESFEPLDILYLSGTSYLQEASLAAALELKTQALAAKAFCVLDPSLPFAGAFRKQFKGALGGMRLVLPNLAEARLMTGFSAPIDCASNLRDSGARVAIITLGAEGCYLDSTEYRGILPGRPVDRPPNSSGAGGTFSGILLAALTQGVKIRAAAARANDYASRFIESSSGE